MAGRKKVESQHKRTIFVGTVWSPTEHARLLRRVKKSGIGITVSQYIRAAALVGREFEIDTEAERRLLNEMTRVAQLIGAAPPSPAQEAALKAAEEAFLAVTKQFAKKRT